MTHIVPKQFNTKKAFKQAIASDANSVYLEDPSFFSPVSGYLADVIAAKGEITVTNHPKRSWFARVFIDNNGNIKVD